MNSSDNDGGGFSEKLKIGLKAATAAADNNQALNNQQLTNNVVEKTNTKHEKRASERTSSRFEQKKSSVRDRVNSSL